MNLSLQISKSLALLFENEPDPRVSLVARQVLDFIRLARPQIQVNFTEDLSEKSTSTAKKHSLPSSKSKTCEGLDAVILWNDKSFVNSDELKALATIQPFFFPSIRLVSRDALKSGVQGLDLTLVSGVNNDSAGNETSREAIERLAHWTGAYASQCDPPKPLHCVAPSVFWESIVTEVLSAHYPSVVLRCLSIQAALTVLTSHPTALNGIVLTAELDGVSLCKAVRMITCGTEGLLASAVVMSPSTPSPRNCPVVIKPGSLGKDSGTEDPVQILPALSLLFDVSFGLSAEAAAISRAIRRTLDPIELVGSDILTPCAGGTSSTEDFMGKFMTHLDYYMEAADSPADCRGTPSHHPSSHQADRRRPMGVIEKILTHAAVGLSKPEVLTGEIICVRVDWTLTSEILWAGMEKTYDRMGRPRLHRNDRMWLAIDHTVDPRTNHRARQRGLIEKAESFQREAKLINFLPANTSILHTDFTRDRALPGQIIVGCDSHSCSAGCMGGLAVGLGAADVVMPMVTGETWFRVPEICRIDFVGKLPFGVGGKDVILHILGLFKRNTIAFQRAVEYGGPSLSELSMDARFAIANMTTEFGGMGACFEADERTAEWITLRPHLEHQGGLYFRADQSAEYAEVRTVDLSEVESTIALYPEPDNVVPVTEKVGTKLDGCFIGACTTTEEDLILGALVLEAGLRAGMVPCEGQRRVTPGSLSIINNLERHGILDIYREAKFDIGAPGCSYCVGINDVDVAGEGEVWLSSQNRNFRNRMGKGAIGSITCAAVVAASSFGMVVTDPRPLLVQIDRAKLTRILGRDGVSLSIAPDIREPDPVIASSDAPILTEGGSFAQTPTSAAQVIDSADQDVLRSKVQRFGENVDT